MESQDQKPQKKLSLKKESLQTLSDTSLLLLDSVVGGTGGSGGVTHQDS